jgi:hypothetical protein
VKSDAYCDLQIADRFLRCRRRADYNFEIVVTRNKAGTDTNTDSAVVVKVAEIIIGVTKSATNR